MGVGEAESVASYTWSRARIADTWDEAAALIEANHAETGALPKDAFKPAKDGYLKLEEQGIATAFVMRRTSGELAGYAVLFLINHLHYPSVLMAYQDALFVRAEDRGPQVAEFLRYQDEELLSMGAQAVIRHVKPHRDYSLLLAGLGYQKHETSYLRVFAHGS